MSLLNTLHLDAQNVHSPNKHQQATGTCCRVSYRSHSANSLMFPTDCRLENYHAEMTMQSPATLGTLKILSQHPRIWQHNSVAFCHITWPCKAFRPVPPFPAKVCATCSAGKLSRQRELAKLCKGKLWKHPSRTNPLSISPPFAKNILYVHSVHVVGVHYQYSFVFVKLLLCPFRLSSFSVCVCVWVCILARKLHCQVPKGLSSSDAADPRS